MRLGISNIAWDIREDEAVFNLLRSHAIDAIDIAPGKYFPEPKTASAIDIGRVRDWWGSRGIDITGMQALLFGTTGLNLFGCAATRAAMLDHLNAICRIGSSLRASKLVFGSPKNRDRAGLSDADAHDLAIAFFQRLGDIACEHGVVFCLEPNPPRYGANFMVNSTETASIVTEAAHPAIRMQLDTGALAIDGEDSYEVIRTYAGLIGHVHASEPDLVTLGDCGTDHARVAAALAHYLPNQVVSIEMLPAKNESNLAAIERALGIATHYYRDAQVDGAAHAG